MSHHCDTIVIRCMDFRLRKAFDAWADEQYGDYDGVGMAGGARALIDTDPATRATALKQFQISVELHTPGRAVLTVHQDCGAAGGSAAFGKDAARERKACETDLHAADQVLRKHFPSLTTVLVIQTLDGTVTVVS